MRKFVARLRLPLQSALRLLSLPVFCLAAGTISARAEPFRVVAYGDSLSAGFSMPANAAFPAVLEAQLKRDGYDARVVNASVSGETTAGGLARAAFSLKDGADLVIVELGANDMLRGFDPGVTRDNLERIIALCEAKGAKVILAGMRAGANFGAAYKKAFDSIYPDLAQKRGVALYPFFLEGVIGDKALVLPDGLHPTPAGVGRIVGGIAPLVEKSLDSLNRSGPKEGASR